MSAKDRFSSRGRLWVDSLGSRIVKSMIRKIFKLTHKLLKGEIKDRNKLRNPRVGFLYDFFNDLSKTPELLNIKNLIEPFRDFTTLLCDDDRAYFYAYIYAMTKLFLKLPDFSVTEEDWYLSPEDRRKFNAIRETVSRILRG